MPVDTTLFYAYDPMCSWCWGYAPTWLALKQQLNSDYSDQLQVTTLLGGLAQDSRESMPDAMQEYLQQTWRRIEEQIPGTRFNHDFWTQCAPRRSTWPACRAVIAARSQGDQFAEPMSRAIQEAYYLEARNPSRRETLEAIAEEVGLNIERFSADLDAESTREVHEREMRLSRSLGVQGFPSLALLKEGTAYGVILDYGGAEKTIEHVERLLNQ